MWIFDRQTLFFLEVNGAAQEKYGYSRADFMKMKITDILRPEDHPRFLEYLGGFHEGIQKQGLWKHQAKNGASMDVEIISHAIHWGIRPAVLAVIHDVTELAQTLLRQQAAAIRASMDGMGLLNAEGEYIYLNEAHAKVHGYDNPQELLGKSWQTLYEETEAERIEKQILPVLHSSGQWRGECIGKKKNGQPFPQEVSLTIIEEGGLVFVVRDITDRKMIETERNRLLELEKMARAKAEMANRAKDEFLAMVSHELRTPMAAMMGWMWLVRYGAADAPTRERAFDIIERNMKLQAQISEDLLDISSIVTGKLQLQTIQVNLMPILRSAIDVVRPASEAKCIKIQCNIHPSEGCVVLGDPDRLQQIFWNLLSNAVKFTPQEGQVTIGLKKIGQEVELTISDNGQGITPEFLPYLFDCFRQEEYSLTRKYRGLGLGLAIVRHLVEMHGGTVSATSEGSGKGSVFSVKLPIAAQQIRSSGPESQKKHAQAVKTGKSLPMLSGIHVLVVDDAADNCMMIKAVLERAGAKVTAVDCASQAMKELPACKPDILVSDIMMPEEDGYSLIRKIRALNPEQGGNIPAIALTACARIEDRSLALLAGFQVYVTKPVEALELTTAVADLLNRPSGVK